MKFYDKICLLIDSLKKSFYYSVSAVISCECGVNVNSPLMVSMTSFGLRKNFVFLTIESILKQEVRASMVVLWLHENDKPKWIAKWILARQEKRGLKILFVNNDVRSYKKLSFTPDSFPDINFYITADDDVFYPDNWLAGFYENININPDAIYCYRGRIIEFDNNGALTPYPAWQLATRNTQHGNFLLPTGVSGICYPKAALDERVADYRAITELCPYADDIWYKTLTVAKGYRAILISNDSIHFTPIITGFTKGLEKINVQNDQNSRQFINAMNYFKLDATSFRD